MKLMPKPKVKSHHRRARGAKAYRAGQRAEIFAILWLWLKGYRILGYRTKTPMAEIDIVAVRKKSIHLIEVKLRKTIDQAHYALGYDQAQRLKVAGLWLMEKKPRLAHFDLQIDMLLLAPWAWPVHIQRALEGD